MPLFSNAIENDSSDRDAKFTLFYALMNLATLVGTFLCAVLGECINWGITFSIMASASAGALLLIFFYKHLIKEVVDTKYNILASVFSISVVTIGLSIFLKHIDTFYDSVIIYILPFISMIVFAWLLFIERDRKKILALGAIIGIETFFFILYEQSANSLVLFAEQNVDRTIGFLSFIGLSSIPTAYCGDRERSLRRKWTLQKNYRLIFL